MNIYENFTLFCWYTSVLY